MRRLLPLSFLLILLALVACGGTQITPDVTAPQESRILTETNGKVDVNAPVAPATMNEPTPDAGSQALTLAGMTQTTGSDGNLLISGQVTNQGQTAIRVARVAVEVVDGAGKRIVRQQFAYPALPTLQPGETAAWQGQTRLKLAADQTVRVTVEGESPDSSQ